MLIAICIMALLASCKKDAETCTLSTSAVSATYEITAVRYKASPSSSEVDYYNQFFPDPCQRDDRITLNSNGTYIMTDAGVACTPPGDDNGTWSLSGNTMTIDGEATNVDNFNCSTLTISISDVNTPGDRLILVLTRR